MESKSEVNKSIAREYVQKVFNEHNPHPAKKYCTPDVKWHGGTLVQWMALINLTGLLTALLPAILTDLASRNELSYERAI